MISEYDRRYPQKPLLGVGAIVIVDNKILLVKRGSQPGKNLWSIPGGLVETGETVEEAVKRELKEETGLEGTPTKLINIAEVIILDTNERVKFHYVIFDYLVELDRIEKPEPSSDVLDVGFFNLDEASRLKLTKPTYYLIRKLGEKISCDCQVSSFVLKEKE